MNSALHQRRARYPLLAQAPRVEKVEVAFLRWSTDDPADGTSMYVLSQMFQCRSPPVGNLHGVDPEFV
jgi:hypothetical protein